MILFIYLLGVVVSLYLIMVACIKEAKYTSYNEEEWWKEFDFCNVALILIFIAFSWLTALVSGLIIIFDKDWGLYSKCKLEGRPNWFLGFFEKISF